MKIKRILSCLMSAVMLFSFAPLYSTQNGSAMAVDNTEPATFIESEPTLTADSSLGGFITNAMKSEDIIEAGEQESDVQYSGDYGIEDVTYDIETNTLSLFTWQIEDCTAVVGFYSDDGKRMYTSEKVEISKDDEVTTFDVDTTKLPESFLVEAYLINEQLMPLCNSYVYNKMTKEMQEILSKTVNDFDPELVVQIDETDDTNNFYVLSDNTILLDSTPDTNTVVSADFETGTYVFGNIDDSMRNLAEGDIFSAATDMGVIAAEIETITIDGDTATITGTSDEEELFQFIKIDTSAMDPSLLDEYTIDMSEADEGVSLSDKSFDETPIPEDDDELNDQEEAEDLYASIGNNAPETVTPKGDIHENVGLTAEPTFTIKEKKAGASGNGFSGKVNFVVSMPIEIKAEFYWSLGYSSFELKSGYALKAKGSASINGELKISAPPIDFPIAGVFHLALVPRFVVKGSVEVSFTYQKSFSAGFHWDTNTWKMNKCDGLKVKVEDKVDFNLEATFFIGVELDFKGYIISIKTCSINFPLDVGIRIKATLPIAFLKVTDTNGLEKGGETSEGAFLHLAEGSTEEAPDTLYNCDVFVEIDVDFQIKLSGELKIADYDWNPFKDKMKIKADIFELTWEIGKFYLAIYPDRTGARKVEFGSWDDLKGKEFILYKTTVKVYDKDRQPLSGALINDEVTTGDSGEEIYYLSPGLYKFTCSCNGEKRMKPIKIIDSSRTVSFVMGGSSSHGSDDPYDPTEPDDSYDSTDPNSPEVQESLKYLDWISNDEGNCYVVYNCDESAVRITIPREIYGKPVTGIYPSAFAYCTKLTEITIPDSVTSIGGGAFIKCSSLTEINIPDGVTSIGGGAFRNCESLTKINIPDGVTSIGNSTFSECRSLTEINIPDGVISIGDSAFYNCSKLTEINIPDGVTSIGNSTFSECRSLTEIIIPDGVTSIGNCAFSNCRNITDIKIPNNVTSIGGGAFLDCEKLIEINIPDGVPSIGDSTFRNCSSLTAITIPDSVTRIGVWAFEGCAKLTEIHIPDGVPSIGDQTFSHCLSLTEINIPNSVTSIGDEAFSVCTKLTEVTIPDSVTSIGDRAFDSCTLLNTIIIQNTDCQICDSEYTISICTIYGYTDSTAQSYAEKYGRKFVSLGTAPAVATPVSYLPAMKTASEPVETEFTFTQEVPAADIYNFYVFADENAEDLLSADNLLYIKQVKTESLSVEIPYILGGDYPDRVERLVRFESPDPGLVLDESSEDGTVSLIDYTGSAEELAIPAQMNGKPVTSIESGAFEGCDSIVSVTVPESVSSIGESAFASCENLATITIQNPDCEIFDSAYTICNGFDEESGEPFFNGTIYGYEGSTAQEFAEKYGYSFEILGEKSDTDHKLGDLDGDGTIDSTDASEILTEYAATQTGAEPSLDKSIADVNSDGFVDSTDASSILSYYAFTMSSGVGSFPDFIASN